MGMQTEPAALDVAEPAKNDQTSRQRQLTDLLNVSALQEIQDGYTSVTGLQAVIVDNDGVPITQPSDCPRMSERREALKQTLLRDLEGPLRQRFDVPIAVDGKTLGSFVLTGDWLDEVCEQYHRTAEQIADRFAVDAEHRDEFLKAVENVGAARQHEAVRFVFILADAIAEVCRQNLEMRQRVEELSTLYRLSTLLAAQRDLQHVLETVASSAADVLNAKASSIRLIDPNGKELLLKTGYNLSNEYLSKGAILLERSTIDRESLEGDGKVVYIEDMASDPRTLYPEDAKREGLASILSAGMVYRGKRVGVMRVYSEAPRKFTEFEHHLLHAIANLAAAAIEDVRLEAERVEANRVRRQVELAGDVQRRLMPSTPPEVWGFEAAGRWEPSFELGGDFFDFIPFEHTLGVVLGDVVGKGVPASLLMATVRAAIRAHAEDTYDLDEIMSKVNTGLARDTRDNEFVTAFYGTFDNTTGRLTYCSAGHDPALLLRDGNFIELTEGGTVLGVDYDSQYDKGLVDLQVGDILFVYSDGVPDALNFNGDKFGRDRIRQALLYAADMDAAGIVNHVLWEVRRFVGLNAASDDMTLVAVRVTDVPERLGG
jgi:sigma-B regulation protein RsbU (phosphoserine phosphatase)